MNRLLLFTLASMLCLNAAKAQEFRFTITGVDAGGWWNTLQYGVHVDATGCEDTLLGERNNYGPPPFPFAFTWGNPAGVWLCDDDDCYSCGRISDGGEPPLDLRPFVSEAQVDTYRIAMYSYDGGFPFQLTWSGTFELHCDSMKLYYEGSISGPVTVDMLSTGSHTITDASVGSVYIIKSGAKNIPNAPPAFEQEFRFWIGAGAVNSTILEYGVHVDATICEDTLLGERNNDSSVHAEDVYAWTDPSTVGAVDSGDCFGWGRIAHDWTPALDLRPFISETHVDTYRVAMYTVPGVPVGLYWSPEDYDQWCDSLRLVYYSDSVGQVSIDMFNTSYHYVYDASVESFLLIRYGVKHIGRRPTLEFDPNPVVYFPIYIGAQQFQWVEAKNNRGETVNITSIESTNPEFTPLQTTGSIAPYSDGEFRVRFSPMDAGGRWADLIFHHDKEGSPDTVRLVGSSRLPIDVRQGWNLVSNPVISPNNSVQQLFPFVPSGHVYAFSPVSGYSTGETLANGHGYWLNSPRGQRIELTGESFIDDTIDVTAGWNIIGSLSRPLPIANITPLSTSIRSGIFGYGSGYAIVDSLVPGCGYWVNVVSDGQLILSMNGGTGKPAIAERPDDMLRRFSSLTFGDKGGNRQTIYLGKGVPGDSTPYRTDLPPIPPAGGFDVRFASGTFLELVIGDDQTGIPILLSSAEYPVTVEYQDGSGPVAALLSIDGVDHSLTAGAGIRIPDRPMSVSVRLSGPEGIPTHFALEQNYPNPFNPTTNISYSVPEQTQVILIVYDLLGREVETLVRQVKSPGTYSIRWNSSGIPSGVYYYRLMAGDFAETRRMMVMK